MASAKELLQQRAEELTVKRDEIMQISTPLREQRDALKNEALAKSRIMDLEIKKVEVDLFDINMELGMIARAAGGRKMSDSKV